MRTMEAGTTIMTIVVGTTDCFICYHERFIFDFRVIERIPMAESMIDDLVSGGVVEIRRQI